MKYIIITNDVKNIPEKYIIDKFIIINVDDFYELEDYILNNLIKEWSIVIDYKYVNNNVISKLKADENANIIYYNKDKKIIINKDNEKEPIIYIFKTEQEKLDFEHNLEDIVIIPDDIYYICTDIKSFYQDYFIDNKEINSELAPSYKHYQDINKIIFISYYNKCHHLVPIDELTIFNNSNVENKTYKKLTIKSIPQYDSQEAIDYLEVCKKDLIDRIDTIEKANASSIDTISKLHSYSEDDIYKVKDDFIANKYDNKLIIIPNYKDIYESTNNLMIDKESFITTIKLLKRIGLCCNYIVLDPSTI